MVTRGRRTWALGHRGASGEAPENTARAFALAAEQGADGIELDVQPSADGALIVMHDDTVDRTTDGRGRVADLTAAEIARLDAGAGERVPTLEEALTLARGRLFVDIEIKDPGIEPAVAAVVDRLGMAEQVAISSFYPASLAATRAVAPHLPRWLLVGSLTAASAEGVRRWAEVLSPLVQRLLAAGDGHSAALLAAAELGARGLAPHHTGIDATLVARAGERGLAVVAWTVNAPDDIRRMLALGVDAIISDHPARVVAARAEAG